MYRIAVLTGTVFENCDRNRRKLRGNLTQSKPKEVYYEEDSTKPVSGIFTGCAAGAGDGAWRRMQTVRPCCG